MRVRPALPVLSLWCAVACAKMEPPPGGPPDLAPPQLLATRPDSFARVPNFSGSVEFTFDEVISEGGSPNQGAGTGDLEKLVILSPTSQVPEVRWRRSRITVKPSEGWKPNRVYRVELLPGVTDLRRNRSTKGKVITFTTGAPLPDRTLSGVVVDWSTSRPAPLALVDALLVSDSLPYRGLTDSTGHFRLGPLPAGTYLVKGVLDQNHDFQPGAREAFDSVRVEAKDTLVQVGELWTFVHDTVAARIRTMTVADSVSATVEFSQPLDPRQRFDPGSVVLRLLPDSTQVRVTSLLAKPTDDSLHARTAGADSTKRGAPDSTRRGAPDSTRRGAPDSTRRGAPDSARRRAADSTRRDSLRADSARRERPGLREVQEVPGARQREDTNQALTGRPRLSDQFVLRVATPWKPEAKYELELKRVRSVSGVEGPATGILAIPKREARDSLRLPGDSLAPRDSLRRLKKRS